MLDSTDAWLHPNISIHDRLQDPLGSLITRKLVNNEPCTALWLSKSLFELLTHSNNEFCSDLLYEITPRWFLSHIISCFDTIGYQLMMLKCFKYSTFVLIPMKWLYYLYCLNSSVFDPICDRTPDMVFKQSLERLDLVDGLALLVLGDQHRVGDD